MTKGQHFMQWTKASAVLILGALSVTACSDMRTVSFACEDGREGRVTWRPDNTALVSFHGDSWVLYQQPSASGARYGDSVHEIWEHQNALTVKTGVTEDAVCQLAED